MRAAWISWTAAAATALFASPATAELPEAVRDAETWFASHSDELRCDPFPVCPKGEDTAGARFAVLRYYQATPMEIMLKNSWSVALLPECSAKMKANHLDSVYVLVALWTLGIETIKVAPQDAYAAGIASCLEDAIIIALASQWGPSIEVFEVDQQGCLRSCMIE